MNKAQKGHKIQNVRPHKSQSKTATAFRPTGAQTVTIRQKALRTECRPNPRRFFQPAVGLRTPGRPDSVGGGGVPRKAHGHCSATSPKVTTADLASFSWALRRGTTPAPWQAAPHAVLPWFGGPSPLALRLEASPQRGLLHLARVRPAPTSLQVQQALLGPQTLPPSSCVYSPCADRKPCWCTEWSPLRGAGRRGPDTRLPKAARGTGSAVSKGPAQRLH